MDAIDEGVRRLLDMCTHAELAIIGEHVESADLTIDQATVETIILPVLFMKIGEIIDGLEDLLARGNVASPKPPGQPGQYCVCFSRSPTGLQVLLAANGACAVDTKRPECRRPEVWERAVQGSVDLDDEKLRRLLDATRCYATRENGKSVCVSDETPCDEKERAEGVPASTIHGEAQIAAELLKRSRVEGCTNLIVPFALSNRPGNLNKCYMPPCHELVADCQGVCESIQAVAVFGTKCSFRQGVHTGFRNVPREVLRSGGCGGYRLSVTEERYEEVIDILGMARRWIGERIIGATARGRDGAVVALSGRDCIANHGKLMMYCSPRVDSSGGSEESD